MSLNRAMVIGNLGGDPELRYLPSGQPVVGFSIRPTRPTRTNRGRSRSVLNGTTLWFSESSLKPVQSISPEDGRFTLKAGRGRENLRAKTAGASASVRRS